MLNQSIGYAYGLQANNPFAQTCDTQLPPQPWTGDIAASLSMICAELVGANDALRNLDGRLFGFVPEPILNGNEAAKSQSIADDFAERLSGLRVLAEGLRERARRLNDRI